MALKIEEVYHPDLHTEMNAYNEVLEKAIKSNSIEPIANFDENHGALLMTKLFENTAGKIAMLVGDFNGDISSKPNYIEALRNCLEVKGVKIRVLILERPKSDSIAYKLILESREKRGPDVQIRFATPKTNEFIKSSFEAGDKILHFSVFDENKFRLELSPETYKAVGSFNNTDQSKFLLNIFDEAFKTAVLN
jgi:hypothetical protein